MIKPLLVATLALSSTTLLTFAQSQKLTFESHNRPSSCSDILEIDHQQKKAYCMYICANDMKMSIGISKYNRDASGSYVFTPIPISQHLSSSVIKHINEGNEAKVVFLDMYGDSIKFDSLIVFRQGANNEILNHRSIKNSNKLKNSKVFVFNESLLGKKTHFTIPYLHRVFQDDVIFELPDLEDNLMVIQLYFPSYFIPRKSLNTFDYKAMDGIYQVESDSLIVNKKQKSAFVKISP